MRFVLCATVLYLSSFLAAAQEAPRIIYPQDVSPAVVSAMENWRVYVWPRLLEVSGLMNQFAPKVVTLQKDAQSPSYGADTVHAIVFYPTDPSNTWDGDWLKSITHEMVHLTQSAYAPFGFVSYDVTDDAGYAREAHADATAALTMQRVSDDVPRMWTTLTFEGLFYRGFTLDAFTGNRSSAFGTISAMGYYSNGGPLEALAHRFWNGSLIPLDNAAVTRHVTDRQGFLAAVDEASNYAKIDGVPASAFYLNSPSAVSGTMWKQGPRQSDPVLPWEGRHFGIIPDDVFSTLLTSINTRQPVANSTVSFAGFLHERTNDTTNFTATYQYAPWRMKYTVSEPSGNIIRSGNTSGQSTISATLDGFIDAPTSAYRIDACVALDDGTCDSHLTDVGYTLHLPLDTNFSPMWLKGLTIVILNGPRFDQWADSSSVVIKDDGGAKSVNWYPGLLVLSGASRDIVLEVAGATRTISPDTGGEFSRIAYLTNRPSPYAWYVGDSKTNLPASIAPGSLAVLNGWNLTRGETSLPRFFFTSRYMFRFTPAQCEAKVWINDSAGNLQEAPILACSFTSLLIQVPGNTALGSAAFAVTLAEGSSSIIHQEIAGSNHDANPR